MEILREEGLDEVARVFVWCPRAGEPGLVEFVDGLDTRYCREEKWIINVSTQIGCPVRCRFCDAGGEFRGNLTADEMLAQVRFVVQRHRDTAAMCAKLKVHFARMGEPALNDAVPDAMERLPEEIATPGLWACIATVTPQRRDAWFDRLIHTAHAVFPQRFQLQFSVNSTDEAMRRWLMPYPIEPMARIAEYGERFYRPGDRKPVLNFALAEAVPFDAAVIAGTFDPSVFAVKLTPLNPTAQGKRSGMKTILRESRQEQIAKPLADLNEAGFEVIVSIGDEREDLVGSNCGQAVRRLLR